MPRPEAAVATDVEVPAVLRRDDAEVLALRLRAFTGAAGHAGLDLVRRTKPAVAQLELDRETHRVLDAVATPGLADARLHRPQRLAVGMPRLEAGVDESPPDRRQLLDACAEHVDALSAGDLRIKVEVTRDLADVYKANDYTLVWFYPKALTGGCTKQGCSLRDAATDLKAKGVAIVGVSVDPVEKQKEFKDVNHFPYPLIADTDQKVLNAFGQSGGKMAAIDVLEDPAPGALLLAPEAPAGHPLAADIQHEAREVGGQPRQLGVEKRAPIGCPEAGSPHRTRTSS